VRTFTVKKRAFERLEEIGVRSAPLRPRSQTRTVHRRRVERASRSLRLAVEDAKDG
jgi:hypothetical protein